MSKILYPDQLEYLNSFDKEKDELILEMEEYSKNNRIPILETNASEFLEQLIMLYRPKNFLEIGTAIGYSTIRVSKLLKKEAALHTIELSKDNIKLAKSFIRRANQTSRIKIFEGNAIEILPELKDEYDFIFLDADKEDYLDLFHMALKLLKLGGVILVDNLLWSGYVAADDVPDKYKNSTEFIRKFNATFLNLPNLKSTILPIGDGLGLGIKTA